MVDPRIARSRTAVIEAALELLGDVGYAGLSIDAISKRSGVARTTIYRHWSSLAEIVHEAAVSTSELHAPPDTGDARADLRAMFAGLAHKLTQTEWGRMLPSLVDAAGRDPEILAMQERFTADRREAGMCVIRLGAERGQVRTDVDLEMLAEMVVGALFARRLINHQPLDDEFLDRLVDTVWPLIAAD